MSVQFWVYRPESKYQPEVDATRCMFAVMPKDYWRSQQCSRKHTTERGGVKVCTAHAKKIDASCLYITPTEAR